MIVAINQLESPAHIIQAKALRDSHTVDFRTFSIFDLEHEEIFKCRKINIDPRIFDHFRGAMFETVFYKWKNTQRYNRQVIYLFLHVDGDGKISRVTKFF